MLSTFITLVVVIVIVGLAIWLVDTLPIDTRFKTIIKVLAVLFVFLYILSILGIWSGFRSL